MPYIGRDLDIGARKIISVSGSSPATSYTLQSSSVNYYPSAAQNLIVSISGVIQAPGTAYTISGATIENKNGWIQTIEMYSPFKIGSPRFCIPLNRL